MEQIEHTDKGVWFPDAFAVRGLKHDLLKIVNVELIKPFGSQMHARLAAHH